MVAKKKSPTKAKQSSTKEIPGTISRRLAMYSVLGSRGELPLTQNMLDLMIDKMIENCTKNRYLNLVELYHSINISYVTGNEWRKKFPEFDKAVRECKETIGSFRYRGVTEGKLKPDFLRMTQYRYMTTFDEAEKRKQSMTQDQSPAIYVSIPDDLKQAVKPSKKEEAPEE